MRAEFYLHEPQKTPNYEYIQVKLCPALGDLAIRFAKTAGTELEDLETRKAGKLLGQLGVVGAVAAISESGYRQTASFNSKNNLYTTYISFETTLERFFYVNNKSEEINKINCYPASKKFGVILAKASFPNFGAELTLESAVQNVNSRIINYKPTG